MATAPDFSMNRLMHHAFQRDLDRMAVLVRQANWAAAVARWRLFDALLTEHHTLEDTYLWPLVAQRSTDPAELALVEEMAAEHVELHDSLARADEVMTGPAPADEAGVAAALAALDDVKRVLGAHCEHEEADAEPLLAAYVRADDLTEFHKATRSGDTAMVALPWIADGASPADRAIIWGRIPGPVRLFLKPRMERKYRAAVAG